LAAHLDKPIKRPVAVEVTGRDLPRSSRKRQRKPVQSELLPLEYMLSVINDSTASPTRRARMALAAAPYCHHPAKR
jgi:hypothetical protein